MKEKRSFRFNIIDLFIIFLAAIVIVGGIFIYRKVEGRSSGDTIGAKQSAEITVVFPVMNAAFRNNFAVGDTILSESRSRLGIVTDLLVEPAYVNLTATDSNIIKSGKTERYYYPENEFVRITLTFRSENVTTQNDRHSIADTYIGIGEKCRLRNAICIGDAVVEGFNTVTADEAE